MDVLSLHAPARAQERKMADLSVLAFTLVVGAIHRRCVGGLGGTLFAKLHGRMNHELKILLE